MSRAAVVASIAVLAFAAPAASQTFGIGAFAGVSLPMGDYGRTNGGSTGGAELGFSAGLDLFYPLRVAPGLSWLTTASITAHSADQDMNVGPGTVSGGYLHIPLLTGLRFDIPLGPTALFATGQLGLVLSSGPSVGQAESGMGVNFGFALGGGIQATQNISAGVKFYPLGSVDLGYDDPAVTLNPSVSWLDVFIGFGVR